uniref:Uncharacterized protein n=1 Tax=Alexandrium monilatum TaxID=311494 RepID=A0A7S4QZ30_9DINO
MALAALLLAWGLLLAGSEQLEETTSDDLEQPPPDASWAWQSLMQVHQAGLPRLPLHQGARSQTERPNATAGSDLLASMPAVSMSAARAAASWNFDPFTDRLVPASDTWRTFADVFPRQPDGYPKAGEEGWQLFTAAPLQDWVVLGVLCVVLSLVDFYGFQRFKIGFRTHLLCVFFWIIVAAGFGAYTFARLGGRAALDWVTGYFMELILSIDNLFVFHLVLETFKVPEEQIHKAVLLGIIGAVAARFVIFMVVGVLLHYVDWVRFPVGMLLVYSGIQAARSSDEQAGAVEDTCLVKGLQWVFGKRLLKEYDPDARLFVWYRSGFWQVTLLAMVVVCIELSDIVFALDSVSAKTAQISNQYVAFSSTVLAMYGLRALFFVIKDLVHMFDLLQYGLCLLLVFLGLQLIFDHYIQLPSAMVSTMILSVIVFFILASIARDSVRKAGISSEAFGGN